jgi:hypothetical protein
MRGCGKCLSCISNGSECVKENCFSDNLRQMIMKKKKKEKTQ